MLRCPKTSQLGSPLGRLCRLCCTRTSIGCANQFTRRTFGMMGTPMDGRLGGDFIDTYAAMVLPLLLIGVALGLIAT